MSRFTIRHAIVEDAPAMGQVMVETWLSAHKEHISKEAWQKRVTEWTPDVSANAWARALREIADELQVGKTPDTCIYLAVDEADTIAGIVIGYPAEQADTGEIGAIYIHQRYQRQGIGRKLIRAAATYLANTGLTALHIAVLATNTRARRFYEAIGGQIVGERAGDEDGPQVVYGWSDVQMLI